MELEKCSLVLFVLKYIEVFVGVLVRTNTEVKADFYLLKSSF